MCCSVRVFFFLLIFNRIIKIRVGCWRGVFPRRHVICVCTDLLRRDRRARWACVHGWFCSWFDRRFFSNYHRGERSVCTGHRCRMLQNNDHLFMIVAWFLFAAFTIALGWRTWIKVIRRNTKPDTKIIMENISKLYSYKISHIFLIHSFVCFSSIMFVRYSSLRIGDGLSLWNDTENYSLRWQTKYSVARKKEPISIDWGEAERWNLKMGHAAVVRRAPFSCAEHWMENENELSLSM